MVGTSGSGGIRLRDGVASARNAPDLTSSPASEKFCSTAVTCPPSSALMAGAPPVKGT